MEDPLEKARCAALTIEYAGQATTGHEADVVCHMAREIGDLVRQIERLRCQALTAGKPPLASCAERS